MKSTRSNRIVRYCLGLSLIAGVLSLSAQTIEFIVEPPIVQLGQAAQAEFRVRGVRQAIQPQLPNIDGLEFSYRGQSIKMTTINGKVDQYVAHQYNIIPLKAGEYSIGPFSYKLGSSTYGIPEQKLKVVSSGGQDVDWDKMLFMEMDAKTNLLYVGQTVDVDFSLYSRTGLRLEGRITPQQLPTTGVTIKEMNELTGRRQQIDGNDYQVRRFRITFQLLTAGTFTFEPKFTVNVLMQSQQRTTRRSFWDDPFASMNQYQRLPMTLSPDPMMLSVLNPPQENRPENYQGAMGTFQMNVIIRPTSLAVGEPVTIQTVLSGQGNVESITAPEFDPGDGFRTYESKMISQDLNRAGTAGRKIFEQVVIPRSEKNNILPAMRFVYFDPEEADYKTIEKGPFTLDLSASTNSEEAIVVGNANQPSSTPVEVLNQDIAYVKSPPSSWKSLQSGPLGNPAPTSLWLHFIASSALIAGAGVYRFRHSQTQDVSKQRRMQAPAKARKGLEKAKTQTQAGESEKALETLYGTLSDFASNLYNWSPGKFDPARFEQQLLKTSMEKQDIEELISILNEAETLKYGGQLSNASPNSLNSERIDRIGLLLTQVERSS